MMVDRLSRRRARGEEGFTLIELLVVIIILGILATVVVFAVRGVGDKGAAAALATDTKTIRTAQEAYCARKGEYGTAQDLVNEGFLSELPTYSVIKFVENGPCKASGNTARSGFDIQCDISKYAGCGAAGATQINGTLLLPMGTADFGTLNSLGINPAITSQGTVHTASELFFNGLLAWGTNGQLEPELAASMPTVTTPGPAAVGQQVTVNLRSGVKFHTTSYFTPTRDLEAQDVQFSFDKALLPFHSRTQASMRPALCNGTFPGLVGAECGGVAGIETPTPLQVVFNFKYAYGPLFNQLNVTETPIISKEWYQSCNFTANVACAPVVTPNPNLNPIGTGPFKLSKYTSGTSIEAVKHTSYFRGPDVPVFGKVVQTVTANTATAVTSGAIDTTVLNGSQQQQAGVLAAVANGSMSLVTGIPRGSGGGNCISTLGFNLWNRADAATGTPGTQANINGGTADVHPILGEGSGPYAVADGPGTKVRRAIAHAFNRQTIFSQVQFNEGRVSKYPIDSRITFAHPSTTDLTPAFNVTMANQLLDDAGWGTEARQTVAGIPNIRFKNGKPLRLEIVTPPVAATPGQSEYGTILKDQMDDVGILIDHTNTFPSGDSQPARAFTARKFDISIASYCNGDDPEVGVRRQIDPNNVSAATFSNMAGYKDPAMTTLLNTAVQGATPAARGATYQTMQEKLAAEMPYIWVLESETTRAVRSNCTGFNFQDTGLFAENANCRR